MEINKDGLNKWKEFIDAAKEYSTAFRELIRLFIAEENTLPTGERAIEKIVRFALTKYSLLKNMNTYLLLMLLNEKQTSILH